MTKYNFKTALVLGAGGFIGSHLVKRLRKEGYWVRGVDIKYPEFSATEANDYIIGDLRNYDLVRSTLKINSGTINEVYQLAAEMGGAGYIFTGVNDAQIMSNSIRINLNILEAIKEQVLKDNSSSTKIFFSSSACIYPKRNQENPEYPICYESSAYPADPDSEYGWEKLFSERLYLSFSRNYRIPIAIARYHNIFGPEGTWVGGREKAPAAICRKIAIAKNHDSIEVWGDGSQTRSFLFIDDCLEGTRLLMSSSYSNPINIGSSEIISIKELVTKIALIAKKEININFIEGPVGVRGRCSDNTKIKSVLSWEPTRPLSEGIKETYNWILSQIKNKDIEN